MPGVESPQTVAGSRFRSRSSEEGDGLESIRLGSTGLEKMEDFLYREMHGVAQSLVDLAPISVVLHSGTTVRRRRSPTLLNSG